MNIDQFSLGCVISTFQKLKDRSYKIVIETWELQSEQLLILDHLYNKSVYAVFWINPIQEMPDDLSTALEQGTKKQSKKKSNSKRLREAMRLEREMHHKKEYPDFTEYYDTKMEQIIKHYLDKLDW